MKKDSITPLTYIEYVMEQMGFSQADLVRGGCGYKSHVSEMINGKRRLSIEFIRAFLAMSNREEMAYLLIRKYKTKWLK